MQRIVYKVCMYTVDYPRLVHASTSSEINSLSPPRARHHFFFTITHFSPSRHALLTTRKMDEPSAQLHLEIRESVVRSLATRRPILHHLNADTSWLLQIPRPAAAVKYGGRIYYNILIDPWFVGGQSDVARWFSQQWHREESKVKSVQEVEEICRQIELLAGGMRTKSRKGGDVTEDASLIDVVAISHEFTDHCHRETLLEVHPDVPVIAAEVRRPHNLQYQRNGN